jgi:hypothetical protein
MLNNVPFYAQVRSTNGVVAIYTPPFENGIGFVMGCPQCALLLARLLPVDPVCMSRSQQGSPWHPCLGLGPASTTLCSL